MESSTSVALTSGIVKGNGDEHAARSQMPVGFSYLCKCGHETGFSEGIGERSDPTQLPLLARGEIVESFLIFLWTQCNALPPAVKSQPR